MILVSGVLTQVLEGKHCGVVCCRDVTMDSYHKYDARVSRLEAGKTWKCWNGMRRCVTVG